MVDFGQMPIGFIKLSDAGQDECEIVVALGNESVWGRGYGYLAVSQCLRLAFFEHRVRKINANIHAENHRSTRLFERARFVRVGGDSRMLHYSLRQHRTVLMVQSHRQVFRQTIQNDASNSKSIAKEFCAVWRKRCKRVCHQGFCRELCGVALTLRQYIL